MSRTDCHRPGALVPGRCASCRIQASRDEAERLIRVKEAAPELLKACKELLEMVEFEMGKGTSNEADRAHAAITKAEGK